MTGPAELLFQLLWQLLPSSGRGAVSRVILRMQTRAAGNIPRFRVRVFTQSEEMRRRFAIAANEQRPQLPTPPFSLLATCYNEAETIRAWLESVASQDAPPTEVVLVDGGSSDGTLDVARRFVEERALSFPVKLIGEKRMNIAEGRNVAAAHASEDILAFTDAGCELDRFWARRLLEPFAAMPGLPVSMGYYRPIEHGGFVRALFWFLLPQIEHLDPETFLPSARSVAVRKEVFAQLRGFPEFLTFAGEDSLFDYFLKCEARDAAFVPEALAFWKPPTHLPKLFLTIKNYARGDAEGGRVGWRYYLGLVRAFALLAGEAFLIVLFGLLFKMTGFRAFLFIEWIFALSLVVRYVLLILSYGPFNRRGVLSSDGWCSVLAVQFMFWAQLIGFLQGLPSRRKVERARRARSRGDVVVMGVQAVLRGDPSADGALIRGLTGKGYFVTHIYSMYPKKPDDVPYDHQFYEAHLRSGFVFDHWEGRSRRGGKFVDLVGDSFSAEIAQRFVQNGYEILRREQAERILEETELLPNQ